MKVLILTALELEYSEVRKYLTNLTEVVNGDGTIYEIGKFPKIKMDFDIVLGQTGMGNELAAIETERAIKAFKPVIVFLIGIAGGIKDVKLGDVVVGNKIYSYEAGKADLTFLSRPDLGKLPYFIAQRIKAECRTKAWKEILNDNFDFNVLLGNICAGEKVVTSSKSALFKFIKEIYNDATAVELEGSGFIKAIYCNNNINSIVIRGISDLIDNKSDSDIKGYQTIAMENACRFGFYILEKLIVDKNLKESNQVELNYTLNFEANFNIDDKPKIDDLLNKIIKLTGDHSIKIEQVRFGSILLTLNGSIKGYEKLFELFHSDKLSNELLTLNGSIEGYEKLFELFNSDKLSNELGVNFKEIYLDNISTKSNSYPVWDAFIKASNAFEFEILNILLAKEITSSNNLCMSSNRETLSVLLEAQNKESLLQLIKLVKSKLEFKIEIRDSGIFSKKDFSNTLEHQGTRKRLIGTLKEKDSIIFKPEPIKEFATLDIESIDINSYIQEIFSKNGPDLEDYQFFYELVNQVKAEDVDSFRQKIASILNPDSLFGFCYTKPFGYSGDFFIIEKIYQHYLSKDERYRKWDKFFHSHGMVAALRNRISVAIKVFEKLNKKALGLRKDVLILGSGPGIETFEFFKQNPNNSLIFEMLDLDIRAIKYAKSKNRKYLNAISFHNANVIRFSPDKKFDLIWSAEFFDYFKSKHFMYLIQRYYEYLKDDGEMIIGNFNVENPSRRSLEIMCDLYFYHRSADELKQFAILSGIEESKIDVIQEPSGINLFLRVKK